MATTGPTLQAALALPTSGVWTATPVRASPLMVDIFNTGRDDMITVTAGAQLVAYGTQSDGTVAPVMTYTVPNSVADIKSTPIVVTDPRTGRKDLFAAMGRNELADGTIEDGRIYGWDLQTGQLLSAWAAGVSTGVNVAGIAGVYGPLTSGDLDGDGVPEIVVTSYSHYVTALRLDGSTMWQWTNDDTIGSGAVIGDIDRTGVPSVVVGGDASSNGYYQAGGWVSVLSNTGILKWRKFIANETVSATPMLADLEGNGYLDIVVGTGLIYDTEGLAGSLAAGNAIYAFDPFGNTLPGWPYVTTASATSQQEVLGTIAVADLTGNGQLDVIAIDRQGILHVVQPNGQDLPGFAGGKVIEPEVTAAQLPDDYSSPIVADVNGDGRPDVVVAAGQYLRAYDVNGNRVLNVSTRLGSDGLYEGIDAAAVVGNMFGAADGTLAFVSWDAGKDNRPSTAYFYSLPSTTLAAPFPTQRRTASGDAVVRSPSFDAAFVADALQGALGYVPDASITAPTVAALNDDEISPTRVMLNVEGAAPTRQAVVTQAFQQVFGAPPDASSLAYWTNFLATGTIRQMKLSLVTGTAFASIASNDLGNEVARLYPIFLNRTASTGEVNAWLATGLPIATIAPIIANSDEAGNILLDSLVTRFSGAQFVPYIAADTRAAFVYDFKRGAREETLAAELVANNDNHAASLIVASYVRDLYRDVLHRDGGPDEVANWIRAVDAGSLGLGQIATLMFNSPEGRQDVVEQEFAALLGRFAAPVEAASLSGYTSREGLILTILNSPEYYAHVGGTDSAYIAAVCTNLAAITAPQALINTYLAAYAKGTPRIQIALDLMTNPALYDSNQAVNFLFQYLPDEQQGVLRSGALPPGAAGQPINPPPALVAYVTSLLASGVSDEAAIGVLLSSPQYINRVTYDKGTWKTLGIRSYS